MIGRVKVVPPSDFPFSDQLRVATAALFVVALIVAIYIAWDTYWDWRAAREVDGPVYRTARFVFRDAVFRAATILALGGIAVARVLSPGPAPVLSFVSSGLLALVAVMMTVNGILTWRARSEIGSEL